jgi:hypothetical protein
MASIGDVLIGEFFKEDGITPKSGDHSRTKMFIVLGKDEDGNYICGVVINSEIKTRNPESQYPLHPHLHTFLKHNSFVNCDNLLCITIKRISNFKKIGKIVISDMELIRKTVIDSKVIKGKLKKKYNLFESFE